MRRSLLLFTCATLAVALAVACVSGDGDDSPSSDDDSGGAGDDDTGDDSGADDDTFEAPDRVYAAEVVDYTVGDSGGYGEESLPGSVLGAPAGFGMDQGNNDPAQVFSLGHGGSITLEMESAIADGEGPDFIVFENAFRVAGSDELFFIEAAFVEVSADGAEFTRFPNDYEPVGDSPQAVPANFHGFAGITPVNANLDPNGDGDQSDWIDPADVDTAGGDAFDLADVGLVSVRFVRVVDTGSATRAPGTESLDEDGTLIEDQGNSAPPSGNKDGFDLDAIVALNYED